MKNYYEEHAKEYIESTIDCDMSEQYNFFLKLMPSKGSILDIGFGSGRDMIHFEKLGYDVSGVDPTSAFYNALKDNHKVYCSTIEEFNINKKFDGIWACASLLHVNNNDLRDVLIKCSNLLKDDGVMYASFKLGNYEINKNGRYFNYLDETKIRNIIQETNLSIIDILITNDVRQDRKDEQWINLIFKKNK